MEKELLTRLTVKVTANSHRPGLVSLVDNVLGIKVAAAPADGKANEELCQTLSQVLHIAPSLICVRYGHSARQKVVEIIGVDEENVFAILRQRINRPSF
jgi:uncharacterized protein (TIGR00251 family)